MALGQSVFTSSHSNSLRLLGERLPGKERIAFLYDDALADDPDAEAGLRRVDFPELDGLRIPADAVVARREYAEADPVAELLLQHVDEAGVKDFLRLPAGAGAYAGVQTWTDAAEGAGGLDEAQLVSLDEIGWLLLHEARSQGRPPRLALVLSGGGAKCAYQLGVVRALEEKLAELRRLAPGLSLDIALVVGTSGGAVNALPVALGVTSTPEGQESFRALWSEMDQRELIRVPWLVRANLGLWFACIQLALVGWGVRRWVSDRGRRYRLGALVLLGLSLVAVALQLLPVSPWALLGRNHVLHHLWLWGSLGALFAAQCLLVLAVGGLLFEAWCRRRGRALRPVPVWLLRLPLLGILLLPLAQGLTMFLAEESLSGGAGIERALSRKLTALVDGHLQRQGLAPLDLHAAGSDAQRLRSVSRQIIERGLLRRDLVLTASCLSRTITVLPSDLYFYAPAAADSPAPGYGPRGVSLTGRPELLLDVMMGSGTIFPLFPARTLNGFPAAGERVELIDGGFAHNSPVEAAVLWGATHIILVNPTPERPLERGSLAGNLAAAFRHLYQQAQLIDARNQGKVAVFSLRPDPNAMCVLDFADNLIAGAVARGYEDARGVVRVGETERLGRPRFRKEAGEPTHWLTVPAEP
jgi:predicted acylesterase/phospholipase RssA